MAKANNSRNNSEPKKPLLCRVPWLRVSFFLFVCLVAVLPFTKTGKDIVSVLKREQFARGKAKGIVEGKVEREKGARSAAATVHTAKEGDDSRSTEEQTKKKAKPQMVTPKEARRKPIVAVEKEMDVRKTVRGFNLSYEAEYIPSQKLATTERKRNDSYVADFKLKVKIPKAAVTAEELEVSNPKLTQILPGLESMLEHSEVSRFYAALYENKANYLRERLLYLGKTLTMHNFYDCQTMLEMEHPETKRKVFLLQGDMDVVSDGSDGDRLSTMPDKIVNSTYYQPFTSYSWKKMTKKANPMIAGWEQRIENARKEINSGDASNERKKWLKSRIKMLKRGIEDMKSNSFLIAEHDPFIVISINKFKARGGGRKGAYIPRVGDYVAVIYKDQVYPAIVGDGGPTFKVGEASLRLAKEINPSASSVSRPVSDLAVTYLIFPGTSPKRRTAPDYELWYSECTKLLEEIGGLGQGYELHQWIDTLPKESLEEKNLEAQEEEK